MAEACRSTYAETLRRSWHRRLQDVCVKGVGGVVLSEWLEQLVEGNWMVEFDPEGGDDAIVSLVGDLLDIIVGLETDVRAATSRSLTCRNGSGAGNGHRYENDPRTRQDRSVSA